MCLIISGGWERKEGKYNFSQFVICHTGNPEIPIKPNYVYNLWWPQVLSGQWGIHHCPSPSLSSKQMVRYILSSLSSRVRNHFEFGLGMVAFWSHHLERGLEIQYHPWLHRECETSLGYIWMQACACVKEKRKYKASSYIHIDAME